MIFVTNGDLIVARGETRAECVAALAAAPSRTTVEIVQSGQTQKVFISCRKWTEKIHEIPTSYTMEFSRDEILADVLGTICKLHGYRLYRAEEGT